MLNILIRRIFTEGSSRSDIGNERQISGSLDGGFFTRPIHFLFWCG
jgi:hypothetical protein